MYTSELVYVIPPYLLNTSLGSRLQKDLSLFNAELAERNCVATTSKYYNTNTGTRKRQQSPGASKCFSGDPILNQIIKDKLIYKLSTIGIVGNIDPIEKLGADEDYLFEIYKSFKSQLLHGSGKKSVDFVEDVVSSQDSDIFRHHRDVSGAIVGAAVGEAVAAATVALSGVSGSLHTDSESDIDRESDNDDDFYDEADCEVILINTHAGVDANCNSNSNSHVYDDLHVEKENVFGTEKFGEFKLEDVKEYITKIVRSKPEAFTVKGSKTVKLATKKYQKLMASPLKTLLILSETEKQKIIRPNPSFFEFNEQFFQYPLPVTWTPLIGSSYKEYLEKDMGLNVSIENGYSLIEFKHNKEKCDGTYNKYKEEQKDKYTNFVTDKAIPPSSGLFYFEVEIQQLCTSSTDFNSLIVTNNEAISSNNSMHMCLGFTKRFSNFAEVFSRLSVKESIDNYAYFESDIELLKANADGYLSGIEMKERSPSAVEHDYSRGGINGSSSSNTLSQPPGTFRGSYAINFEDSLFYNSDKMEEYIKKTTVHHRRLSLNRLNATDDEHGKLDIGFTLPSYNEKSRSKTSSAEDFDRYHTEVIGCGINFFDKSIFYTSNGILIKVISLDQLGVATTDSLFLDSDKEIPHVLETIDKYSPNLTLNDWKSVYPMISVKLNTKLDSSPKSSSVGTATGLGSQPSSAKIITNFGFKEFKYNINNHIHSFSSQAHNSLYQGLLNNISEFHEKNDACSKIEASLLNVQNTLSNLINDFIKGYLNNKGYLNTYGAFESDLETLDTEVNASLGVDKREGSNGLLQKSQARQRMVLMTYIREGDFHNAITYFKQHYSQIPSSLDLVFELKFFEYTQGIKSYVECIRDKNNTGAASISNSEMFSKLFQYGKNLQNEFPDKVLQIQPVSSLLLINDYNNLKDLPEGNEYIINYDSKVQELAEKINKVVLEYLGFEEESNLEKVVDSVDKNFDLLGVKYCDENYMMINFERGYMDL